MVDPEAASVVKHVLEDDGVEAFSQLISRFDPHTALTKSRRLKAIQKFPGKNKVKKNVDVPAVLAKFEDVLLRYAEGYQSQALPDDLKNEAFKELIPPAPEQTVKDVIMFCNMKEDTLSAAQAKAIINERITGNVMNQVIGWTSTPLRPVSPLPPRRPLGSWRLIGPTVLDMLPPREPSA